MGANWDMLKIGAEIVRHARSVIFQLAENAAPKNLRTVILRQIDRLRPRIIPP